MTIYDVILTLQDSHRRYNLSHSTLGGRQAEDTL